MSKFRVFKRVHGVKTKEGSFVNRDQAELRLIDVLAYSVSNFDEYSYNDIDDIRTIGYEFFGGGAIWIEEDGVRPCQGL